MHPPEPILGYCAVFIPATDFCYGLPITERQMIAGERLIEKSMKDLLFDHVQKRLVTETVGRLLCQLVMTGHYDSTIDPLSGALSRVLDCPYFYLIGTPRKHRRMLVETFRLAADSLADARLLIDKMTIKQIVQTSGWALKT